VNAAKLSADPARGNGWFALWAFAAWLFTLAGFFCVVSFLSAERPGQINPPPGVVVPAQWPAAVFNHGQYYLWWTVAQRPFLFGVSLAALLYGPVTVVRLYRRRKGGGGPSSPSLLGRIGILFVLLLGVAAVALVFLGVVMGIEVIGWPTTG
jgi:hypothetical protein